MKKSELIKIIKQVINESFNDDIGKFHQDLQSQIRGKVHSSPRSDYARDDELFTIVGSPVTFISDLSPDKKGQRRVMVKTRDGTETSMLLRNVLPEMPSKEQFLNFIATAYGDRDDYSGFVSAAMKREYDENDGLKDIWNNRNKS